MWGTLLRTVQHFSIIGLTIVVIPIVSLANEIAMAQSTSVGSLSGTITFVGELPEIRKFNLATYPDAYYCGRVSDGKGWRIGPRVNVGANTQFTGAIVFIKNLQNTKPVKNQAHTVKSLNCRFTPFVSLLQKGDDLKFENWDPVLHQIEIFQTTPQGGRFLLRENLPAHQDSSKSEFLQSGRKGIHRSGPPLSYKVKDEGVLFIRCPFHEYMETWGLALSHEYYAISDKEGKFSITGIPTGTYTLVVWHPIGRIEQTIHIREQDLLELNIPFRATRSTFYREPEVKVNPFGIELLGDSKIIPSVERQKE